MSETKKGRNSSIDLLKFMFSLIIVLYHFGQRQGLNLLPGGYIVVEGFFMITGYFMMNSVNKAVTPDIAQDTLKFTTHKFLSFFPTLLFSAAIGFAVKAIAENHPIREILSNSVYILTEIFPLQVTGIATFKATGVSWYLSAMMLALIALYPLARTNPRRFTHIICPVLVALIYGSLCFEYRQLDIIWELIPSLPVLRVGLLRGIAGICSGCMLFDMVKSTKKYNASRFGELFYLGTELLCFAFLFIIICFFSRTQLDFFSIPFFFLLLYCFFGKKSLFSGHFSFKFTKHLGTASLLIYLNHNYWNTFVTNCLSDFSPTIKFAVYILLITLSCIVVQTATLLSKTVLKKIKPFLNKHFVGE